MTLPEEDPDDICLVGSCCQVERCFAPDCGLVRRGVVLDKEDDDVHATHKASHVEGRQPRLKTDKNIQSNQLPKQ